MPFSSPNLKATEYLRCAPPCRSRHMSCREGKCQCDPIAISLAFRMRTRERVATFLGASSAPTACAGKWRLRMDAIDLHYLELTELAGRIRGREVSPVAVTRAQLDRIASLDGSLDSYALVTADAA